MKTLLPWLSSGLLVFSASPAWSSDADGWDDDFSSSSDASESSGAATETSAEASAEAPPPVLPPPSPFEIGLGVQVYSRDLRFTDTAASRYPQAGYGAPIAHYLPLAVMPQLQAALFPFAGDESAVMRRLGFNASFAIDPFSSARAGGITFNQVHYRYSIGVLGKIPVGPITIDPNIAYAGHTFAFLPADGGAARVNTPNIGYQMLELGGDLSFRGNLVSAKLGARYLLVLDVGEIRSATWFPNARSSGVKWGGEVAFALSPAFDAVAGFEYRAYNFNFNPIPSGAPPERAVGGAVDQYIGLSVGLAFHIAAGPAAAASASSESSEPASSSEDAKPDPADFEDF